MDKKQKYFFVLAIITGIILVTGATYALFTYLGVGSKVHSISTATLTMSYTEDTNGISLDGALPTTDATGKNLSNYFDFTVTKTGGIEDIINYEIAAKKEDGNTIEGKWIKLYLTEIVDGQEQEVMAPTTYSEALGENEDTGRPSGMMSLTTGTYPSGTIEKHYRLRMWVSEEYNPQGDGGGLAFTVKINVYGKMKEAVKRLMAARQKSGSTEHFYKYSGSITSIETKQDITVPSTALYQYDVSEAQDGNVIAYLEDDGSGNSTYKLTIGANGGVIFFNENSSNLFSSFSKLTSIDLTNVDTSEVTNMSAMFSWSMELTSLNINNFDTSNVTNMSEMFKYCNGLINLDVSGFNTSKVTDMSNMFTSCTHLTTLNLSGFDTSNVTSMSEMFYGCSRLTTLNVSSFNTSKVTNMYYMFSSCGGVTSLDVSKFDTSQVTNMASMFSGCEGITSLDVSHFNTSKVTDMSGLFHGCKALTTLDLSHFNTSKVTTMRRMFSECSSLATLDVSSFDTSQVMNMNEMFDSCRALTALDVSRFDTSKVTDMSAMFVYCSSLASLDVSHFDTSQVTNMKSMFYSCSSLTTLDVSHFNTAKVTNMNAAFGNCSGLTSLDLRSFDTSKVTDMSWLFQYCSNLTQILVTAGKWTTANATTSYMFIGCGTSEVTYA